MCEITIVVIAMALVLAACTAVRGQEGTYCETFEDGVPSYFEATRPEGLSASPLHYKQGSKSLRWGWTGGEELIIRHGIGDIARTGGFHCRTCFSVWMYVEKPTSGALVFEFREGEKVTGFFRFPLDYTGWRQARPYYHDFPHGEPTSGVDNIRLAAPTGVEAGAVFLDLLKYNTLTYGGNAVDPEKTAQWQPPVPDDRRFPRPERVTEAEREGVRKLLGPEEGQGIGAEEVDELCARVEALGIVRDAHGIRGPGIDAHYQFYASAEEQAEKGGGYWSDEHGPGWMGMQDPGAMTALGRQVAGAYRVSNDADQRSRLADAFLLIADHLLDQVLQAGSGFKWNWWVGGGWADAVFLMRETLAESGRLRSHLDFQLYTYDGGAMFAEGDAPSHMDFYHLTVPRMLRQCLTQVEEAEQVRWLYGFKSMLERSMLQPSSSFKIDGCAYHHNGHYLAYAKNAFGTLPPLLQELDGTPWRLSAEAHGRLRRAMLAQRYYCNHVDLPLSLSGRRPFVEYQHVDPEKLDVLARCGSPDGKEEVDREVAAAYLRFVPEAVDVEPYRSLGVEPEPEPNGTFVMPYAALLSHRRDDWLASVHGQSKYCWGTERQDHHNRFGLFQGMGHLEILAGGSPVSAEDSGRQEAGWDWARYEGTTVPYVPLEMLEEGGREGRRGYSDEPFVGGLSHRGRQGLYAMVVNQPMPGGKTLAGRKSWFFWDDQVLCLGSDITCDEAQHPTQTNLCQKALRPGDGDGYPPTVVDGEDFVAIPAERSLDESTPHWFLDVQQTGYYLPEGQHVALARKHQMSRNYLDEEDTEADFLTAWIDHGPTPSGASYEYMLVVRATPEAMLEVVSQPPYQVLQQDGAAHVVWHADESRWSCVFFEAQEVTPHSVEGETVPITSVDRPCLVMAEVKADGELELGVADPDLNLDEDGVNQPQALRVSLRGAWDLVEAKGSVCAWGLPGAGEDVRVVSSGEEETIIEILCRHGASYDLSLR